MTEKRPCNAYLLFCEEQRDALQQSDPSLTHKTIMIRLGEMWKKLSDEEKKPFKERAQQLLDAFKQRHPEYHYKQKKPKKELTEKEKLHLFESSLPIDPSYLMALGLQTLFQQSNAYNASYFANLPVIAPVSMPPPPSTLGNKSRTATITNSAEKNKTKEKNSVPSMPPPITVFQNHPTSIIPSMPPPAKSQNNSFPISMPQHQRNNQANVRISTVSEFTIPTMPPPSNVSIPTMPPPTNNSIPRMPPPPPTRTPSMPPPPNVLPMMPPPPNSNQK